MIDLRQLRDDPDRIRQSQRARGESEQLVDDLLAADQRRRESAAAYDEVRAQQNTLNKKVGPLRGLLKRAEGDQQAELEAELAPLMAQAQDIAGQLDTLSATRDQAQADCDTLIQQISNVVDPAAPVGEEEDFTVLTEVGTRRDFAAEGFTPRDHVELGQLHGAIDLERGAKVSGSRFYFLTGLGARLEFALTQLALAQAQSYGFIPVIPPALVKPAAMEGTGFLGQAAEDVYHLPQDDLYLVGTSEVPLAAYHMDEIIDVTEPVRYAGFSPCFRREAGSHGKDTRGIFRVHWFDKVEMFSFCDPAEAEAEHERLLAWEREFLDSLELPYRVIDVATGDLGSSAARKFDCEAWIPSQERYREVTSTSNCTQFQSRRLRIRHRNAEGKPEPLATLNGTLCAVTRIMIAVLENHQQADGSIWIPPALRPYLGGMELVQPV